MKGGQSIFGRDPGHAPPWVAIAVVSLMTALAATVAAGQGGEGPAMSLDDVELSGLESSTEAQTESTIVEIPVPITLRAPDDGKIGIRLRLSVFFSWNKVRFEEVGGDDIAASLRTLTVVPGIELMIPVGDRWLVRPYGQIGGLEALNMPGRRWMASLGARAVSRWPFEKWILSTGGRLEYTSVFDENWHRTDEVAFVDVGADFSFPLGFDLMGGPASAGVFVIPRAYFNPASLASQDGFDLGVDAHLEVGASFQIHDKPKVWFVKLPSWYGLGIRWAKNNRSFRVYLGFPF